MAEGKECDLLKKIEQVVKKTGNEDSNILYPLKFHLTVLKDSNADDEIETRMELCQYLLSKMFLDKMDLYPTQPFKCQINEYSDWPLSPLPAELFGSKKQEDKEKIMWFNCSLKVGDVLDCRVSEVLPDKYKLRVIHRYGVTRLLDDLQLMVTLSCAKNEIKILEERLLVCEFVRVAVHNIGIENGEQSVYVTVDLKKFGESSNFRPIVELGRIATDDIPSYVFETPDAEKFSSYSDYLMSKPQFHNPHFYNGLIGGCGIDPKAVCSFFSEYNCKPCNEDQTGQTFLRKSKAEDVQLLAESALKCLEKKQYDDGLKLLDDALKICASDYSLKSKLYDIRSKIYSDQMKTVYNLKSLCDLETAFKLAPEDVIIKQKLLHEIFKSANSYYRLKQYKKAVFGFEFVLKNDGNHRLAERALHKIKTKHANQLLNLEEMSQIDLQEKKKELLIELKKIKTSDVDIKVDS